MILKQFFQGPEHRKTPRLMTVSLFPSTLWHKSTYKEELS